MHQNKNKTKSDLDWRIIKWHCFSSDALGREFSFYHKSVVQTLRVDWYFRPGNVRWYSKCLREPSENTTIILWAQSVQTCLKPGNVNHAWNGSASQSANPSVGQSGSFANATKTTTTTTAATTTTTTTTTTTQQQQQQQLPFKTTQQVVNMVVGTTVVRKCGWWHNGGT